METPGPIAEAFKGFVKHLDGLPDDLKRLEYCEREFGHLCRLLVTGPTKNLRAGIVLAKLHKSAYFLADLDEAGQPRQIDVSRYQSDLLAKWNLGSSPTQVSRMVRAGKLFIDLVGAELPVPETAERLVRFLPLAKNHDCVKTWKAMVKEEGGNLPSLPTVVDYVRKAQGLDEKVKLVMVAAKEVDALWQRISPLLKEPVEQVAAVRADMNKLLNPLAPPRKGKTNLGKDAVKSEASAVRGAKPSPAAKPTVGAKPGAVVVAPLEITPPPVPKVTPIPQNKPVLPDSPTAVLGIPDETHTNGDLLIERHGPHIFFVLMGEDEFVVRYDLMLKCAADLAANWKPRPAQSCYGFPDKPGIFRRKLNDVAAAKEAFAVTVDWATIAVVRP